MVLTINHPIFFKISIPLSLLVMSISLGKLAGASRDFCLMSTCLAMTLVLFINNDVLSEAAWWVTGSYNYLQPIAMGLMSLVIFYLYRDRGPLVKILSLVLIIISCFNELFSILFVIPFIVIITVSRRDYGKYSILYFSSSLAATVFSLTAPGNMERFYKETERWMPDFANLNLIDKVALGFDRMSSHVTEQNMLFLIFLGLLVVLTLFRSQGLNKTQKFSVAVLTFKIAVFFVFHLISLPLRAFTHSDFLDFGNLGNIRYFVPYVFSLIVLFSCMSLLLSLCSSLKDVINTAFIFTLGIASVVMMGLSPTVYASSFRVVFIFDLSVVFVILYLIYNKIKIPQ